jgi:hypothetical protein
LLVCNLLLALLILKLPRLCLLLQDLALNRCILQEIAQGNSAGKTLSWIFWSLNA